MTCSALILCCTLIIPRIGISQDPCAKKEFQYAYIKSNCEITWRCAKDPNNENQTYGKVTKWAAGARLSFCVPDLNDPASGSNTGSCVNNNDITQCISDAINAWIGLCPQGTLSWEWVQEGTAPCIPIKWSSNDHDFGDLPTEYSAAVTKPKPLCATGEIREQCGSTNITRIWINNTDHHLSKYQNVYPCPPGAGCDTKNRTISNPCKTLAHEIGHVFGLLHTGEVDQIPCEASSSDPNNDLMYAATGGGCSGPSFSINDKCLFKKLYCNGSSNVHMSYDKTFFNIFPNPARIT